MNIYKTRPFARLAKKYGISDSAIKASVEEMRRGIVHAALGGNVFKRRAAVDGHGKRGGSRVIVAANLQDRWLFVHCCLERGQADLNRGEEA